MERYDIGDDERLASLVARVTAGDEVVLTRAGEVVARVVTASNGDAAQPGIDLAELARIRCRVPPGMRVHDAAALIRDMRDADIH